MPKDTPSPASGPTWSALFKDDPNAFCAPSSLAAFDSPAAYLQALYRFALEVETTGKGTQGKITLDQRLPTFKNLVVDTQSTSRQLPLLALVNEALTAPVEAYLNNNRELYGNRSVDQVLAELRYPFDLPFDLAHRRCVLGLTGTKPGLGELNYRISLKLPHGQQPENKYGTVQQEAYEAQRLLTLLSPAQQNLLTERFHQPDTNSFYKKHYGQYEPITGQQQFMLHTGLNTRQLQELLASASYRPRLSANVMQTADQIARDQTVGARYCNGPRSASQAALRLGSDYLLHNTTPERHDRLQRMIRLQRWLDLPFAELDTLLHSVLCCENSSPDHFAINDNSLRALGVFRYLKRRYGIKPGTFSAWLYRMPIHSSGQDLSLFDQIFNPPHWLNLPLILDNQPLDLETSDATLYRVCAALGLEDTPQSLGLLKSRMQQLWPPPRRDIETFSSLYRQATLPALFGLSVVDCDQLCQLLGGKTWRQQLVKPTLRQSGSNAPADFLDVLMQLDWAVTWLKNSGKSVQHLRQQLLLETASLTPSIQQRLSRIEAVLQQMPQYLLAQATIDELDLPQPEPGSKPLVYAWNILIAKGLLRAHSLLPAQPKPAALERGVGYMVDRYVTLSPDDGRNQALKAKVKHKLSSQLTAAYTQLQPFRVEVEQFLKDTSLASEAPDLLTQAFRQATRIYANALGSEKPAEILKHLLLFSPNAETELQLPLSREALQAFLLNPHWLDSEQTASSTLRLTLGTLYLFEQFSHLSQTYGVSHATLLNYLNLANPQNQDGEPASLTLQTGDQLARMLGWSASEIEVLTKRLPGARVRSMAELDWLMRCHESAKLTGLSATMLLMATGLTATFSSADWQQVGSAVLATSP
ncbi:hypothetical protein CJF43_12340 [Pseudomonas fragi]|uniref:Toxin n=1 Tax=Pseudomonas fragi TaxID=296 RepID=A0A266LVW7_PSEFR|nr:Tc toxin subunit A [Pseudomonas fragi]OZY41542.1 hypothetical protein CJF43_12340 [Pseudomonas fragi]